MSEKIRVKIISKNHIAEFQLLDLPQTYAEQIQWVLDPHSRDYDWLVVYDDLPVPPGGGIRRFAVEELACPQSHTVLLTYEPSSIKYYGQDYVDQYGMVLTSHEPEVLKHRNRFDMPPVGRWIYGGIEQIQAHSVPPAKTGLVSLFDSAKTEKHTLHHRRNRFFRQMAIGLGDQIDIYGKDHCFVQYKAQGIDGYRYHIAVENHIGPHHWTEKLSDAWLGFSLPLYAGCSNIENYFPPESFIPIDIDNAVLSLARIEQAIADNEYEKRLSAITEARRRVMEDYNLANLLAGHILTKPPVEVPGGTGKILSRHAMQQRDLATLLRYVRGKLASRRRWKRHYRDYSGT